MACNLDNPLLNIALNEMTFFNNDFLGILLIHWFFNFDNDCLGLLAITMFGIVDWFLDHGLYNFSNLMSLDYRLFNFHKLYLFLHNNMMHWPLNYFEFRLLVHFGHSLFHFEYLTDLFVHILGHLSLNDNLFCLHLRRMIGDSHFSLYLFSGQYLFRSIHYHLFHYFDVPVLFDWNFYYIYSLIVSYHLLYYLCWHCIWSLYCDWHLYNLGFAVFVWDLFSVWYALLQVDSEVGSIGYYDSFLLF